MMLMLCLMGHRTLYFHFIYLFIYKDQFFIFAYEQQKEALAVDLGPLSSWQKDQHLLKSCPSLAGSILTAKKLVCHLQN